MEGAGTAAKAALGKRSPLGTVEELLGEADTQTLGGEVSKGKLAKNGADLCLCLVSRIVGCVGCGRCVEKCPISMNIVKVMRTLAKEEEGK